MTHKRFVTLTAREQLARFDSFVALCSPDDVDDSVPPMYLYDGQGIGGMQCDSEVD
jgi:hypothetical protein